MLEKVHDRLRNDIGESAYQSWFCNESLPVEIAITGYWNDILSVLACNTFMRDYIRNKFLMHLQKIASEFELKGINICLKEEKPQTYVKGANWSDMSEEEQQQMSESIKAFAKEMRERAKMREKEAVQRMTQQEQRPHRYMFTGMDGLDVNQVTPSEETPSSDGSPQQEGVIFPAVMGY